MEDIIDDIEVAYKEQDLDKLLQLNAKLDTLKDKYGIGEDIDIDDLTADQVTRFYEKECICGDRLPGIH